MIVILTWFLTLSMRVSLFRLMVSLYHNRIISPMVAVLVVIRLNVEYFLTVGKDFYRNLMLATNWPGKDINVIFCEKFMSDQTLWHGAPSGRKRSLHQGPALKLWKGSDIRFWADTGS